MAKRTITTLRNDLLKVLERLGDNEIDVKIAAEMNNCAGKIIKTVATQLQYSDQRDEKPNIPFMTQ
jgi:hypothetical protein